MSDDIAAVFWAETAERLAELERLLIHAETHEQDVNAMFREIHTIKGAAGVLPAPEIERFAHEVESELHKARDTRCDVSPQAITVLLQCKDHIARISEACQCADTNAGAIALAALEQQADALIDELRRSMAMAKPANKKVAPDARRWQVRVRFGANILSCGIDPSALISYLASLGEMLSIRTLWDDVPRLAQMENPTTCYLTVIAEIRSGAPRQELLHVFDFIADESEISVEPLDEESAPIRDDSPKEVLDKMASPSAARRVVRVDAARLDQLIDVVGELLITTSGTTAATAAKDWRRVTAASEAVAALVQDVRDRALSLRTVKLSEAFARCQRITRDVAQELGKKVQITVIGGETEVDKSVADKLLDPLMHLVRNAVDHGVEKPDERRAAGKSEFGIITLSAEHEGGQIVVRVSDDGRGMQREKVLQRAAERGWVKTGVEYTEEQMWRWVFEPGFSTAEAVSNISGRGVGMDVVRRNVEDARGTVELSRALDGGTVAEIRLPMTLAIIDGFLVRVGNRPFVLPLDAVEECTALKGLADDRSQGYMSSRNEVVPFMRLSATLDVPGSAGSQENVVYVRHGTSRVGLIVDELAGECSAVIKPLGELFAHLSAVSGSTILGTGEVALILDVAGLIGNSASVAR